MIKGRKRAAWYNFRSDPSLCEWLTIMEPSARFPISNTKTKTNKKRSDQTCYAMVAGLWQYCRYMYTKQHDEPSTIAIPMLSCLYSARVGLIFAFTRSINCSLVILPSGNNARYYKSAIVIQVEGVCWTYCFQPSSKFCLRPCLGCCFMVSKPC